MQESTSYNATRYRDMPARLILFFAACIYGVICFCNHYLFRTFSYDYGVYNFAFWDYAHFRISDCPIYFSSHVNFLQDHVSLTFWLFVPLYWMLGWIFGTYTLMFIQTALILAGGWYVYKLVHLKTNHKVLSLLALGQYLFMYGRWTMFDADCNLAIMASSMVPVFIYYFEKKRFLPMFLIFGFILITREDMPLWTLFIGLYMLITGFRDRVVRTVSIVVMGVSIIYFLLLFAWIIPSLENAYKHYNLFNYSSLGKDPGEALAFLIRHPFRTLGLFFENTTGNPAFDHTKPEFYAIYLIGGGYLLFYRPIYLLWFIPILAKKMLNDEPLRWSSDTYYSVEFVSLLPVAVFCILGKFRNKSWRTLITVLVVAGSLGITVYKSWPPVKRSPFWYDQKHSFYKSSFYREDFDAGKVHKSLTLIPKDAAVSATGVISTHLAWREKIYNFPRVEDSRYLVVFTDRGTYPLTQSDFDSVVYALRFNGNWRILKDEYPLLMLEKNPEPDSKSIVNEYDTIDYYCDAEQVAPIGNVFVSTGDLSFGNSETQSREAFFRGTYSIKLTEENQFGFTAVLAGVTAGEKLEITVWCKGGSDNAGIIANAQKPGKYYNADQKVIRKEGEWEMLKKVVHITQLWPGQKMRIYLWNRSKTPVYFDDLHIVRIIP